MEPNHKAEMRGGRATGESGGGNPEPKEQQESGSRPRRSSREGQEPATPVRIGRGGPGLPGVFECPCRVSNQEAAVMAWGRLPFPFPEAWGEAAVVEGWYSNSSRPSV